GEGGRAALTPPVESAAETPPTLDLVVLAPSLEQQRDRRWVDEAVETTAARLSQSGIAYVVPSVASTLRRALAAAGLPETDRLLHIPNVAQSRYLAPIASMAERYALSGQLPMTAVKRLAAKALGVQGRRRLGPTGALHRRRPATLARWLFDFDNTAPG